GGTGQGARMTSPVFNYLPAHDGKTLIFVASEGTGGRGGAPAIYTIQDDGRRMTRIASGSAAPAGDTPDGPPRGFRRFFGGGISHLNLTRDGRTLYFQEGDRLYSVPVSGGGGGVGR